MKIPYKKMSGAGNDFIVVDDRAHRLPKPIAAFVPRVCDRATPWGGADGFIAIVNSPTAEFEMLYFNADGSTGAMCGNGGRCAARFALLVHAVQSGHMEFEVVGQRYVADVDRDRVRLMMPPPRVLEFNRTLSAMDRKITCHYVNVETPHAIIFISDIKSPPINSLNELDIAAWGPAVRLHPDFQPEGANANFAMIAGDGIVHLRTWERGVEGETLACGTGSVATALTAHFVHHLPAPVRIATASGETLVVDFTDTNGIISNLSLEGSAVVEREGEMEI